MRPFKPTSSQVGYRYSWCGLQICSAARFLVCGISAEFGLSEVEAAEIFELTQAIVFPFPGEREVAVVGSGVDVAAAIAQFSHALVLFEVGFVARDWLVPPRNQIRDASTTSRWPGRGDQSPPRCHLRTSPTAQSTAMVKIDQVLASTGGCLDQ